MDTKSKFQSRIKRIGLSLDAFSTGCLVMCLLLFVPYVSGVGSLVMWFLPLTAAVPFVVIPLVYLLIHRVDTLLFGRYHFIMPLSAFVFAPFFVMAWSASGEGALQSCLAFFGLLIFAVGILTYRYCAFSVRARLTNAGIVEKSPQYEIFCLLGCVAAAATYAGFLHYDSAAVYVNTAYVIGALSVLLALIQYLITYYSIPQLGGRHIIGVKRVFGEFYGGIDTCMFLSALFFEAAYAAIAALLVYFGFEIGIGMYATIGVASTVIVAYAISAFFCSRYITRRSVRLSIINTVCVALSAGALVLLAALGVSGSAAEAGLIVAAAVVGMGGAVAFRQSKLRLLTVKPHLTNGIVFVLSELIMFAAAGMAFFVAAIVTAVLIATHSVTAFIYGFALAFVFAVSAFVLSSHSKYRRVQAKKNEDNAMQSADDGEADKQPETQNS